ncbi:MULTISPECIES: hypothetical protein [Clostridium]|uniref:hypothetical protein n=1 Tax=Clostridium TaxID=1485 RepID=UPI000A6F2586|nr:MULTISPECIES: hypothetical protein [Clostridium]MCD2345714.1 hypothetical protein [Clostridium guangxiense]
MEKQKKSSTNNQWASLPEEKTQNCNSSTKNDKTATDNKWTSTLKNNVEDK